MSRLLTLGVLSQAIDPAVKMATDYCNYVIAQGGEVDYTTVYSIYKNEVLTDPDWLKLAFYIDARAGKKPTVGYPGTYIGIYSLIYPYSIIEGRAVSQRFTVPNGTITRATTTTPILYFNSGFLTQDICHLRITTKIRYIAGAGANYPILLISGKDNGGAYASFVWNRFLYASDRFASYLNHYDLSTNTNLPTTAYPDNIDEMIMIQEVDYLNKIHYFKHHITENTVPITVGKVPKLFDDTYQGQSYLYSYPQTEPYYAKIYKL